MHGLFLCFLLLQAATLPIWAIPTLRVYQNLIYGLDHNLAQRPDILVDAAVQPRQAETTQSVLAITRPRVLYPTGFNGFDTGSSATTPDVSSNGASTASKLGTSIRGPASTATNNTSNDEDDDDNDGTSRAIVIVIPIALGTILTLAFGGALMMWCKSKPPDEGNSNLEIVKEPA